LLDHSRHPHDPHSLPTRRSSDLSAEIKDLVASLDDVGGQLSLQYRARELAPEGVPAPVFAVLRLQELLVVHPIAGDEVSCKSAFPSRLPPSSPPPSLHNEDVAGHFDGTPFAVPGAAVEAP